ncbi:MAG: FxSxx-COOH system tetratricopeptide repeat protein [Maledivibacter sp.]|nr:FxSxx-COOH system tetratricopeptide repeat protein [Maledivibacter sp.]
MSNEKKDFFISYTHSDEKWATWVAKTLEDEGYTTTIQAWDFNPGSNFVQKMHEATINCDRTISILSEKYFESLFTQSEWQAAFVKDPTGKNSTLIPIRVSEFRPEGLLKQIIYIDLFEASEEESKKKLLSGVDETKRRRVASGFPGLYNEKSSKKILNLKFRRNRHFSGRGNILKSIKDKFDNQIDSDKVFILTGLGGVGKTQIALEYIFRFQENYEVVWWIESEDSSTIIKSYNSLLIKLGFVDKEIEDVNEVVLMISEWASQNSNWLFVYDNASNFDELYDYIPVTQSGNILITSRFADWDMIGDKYEVNVFDKVEAVDFMMNRTKLKIDDGVEKLVEELGYLPLALEQAAAYILKHCISIIEYYKLYSEYQMKLFEKSHPVKYENSVATTWLLSFNKIQDKKSLQLMQVMAYLYSENIELSILTDLSNYIDSPISGIINDKIEFNEVISKLAEYSLVKRSSNTISIHRLLQNVIQMYDNNHDCLSSLINFAYENIDFQMKSVDSWSSYLPWHLHINVIANCAYHNRIELEKVSYLFHQLGTYYNLILSNYSMSEKLLIKALSIREELMGKDSNATLRTKINLAGLMLDQGRYEEAENHYLSMIQSCDSKHDQNFEIYLTSKGCLAKIYQVKGRFEEAKKLFQDVIELKLNYYGENNDLLIATLYNFSTLLIDMGEYSLAEKYLLEALDIEKTINGEDNQFVADILDSLANMYTKKCKYNLAEKYFQKSLEIRRTIFNPNHRDIANSLNNYAGLCIELHNFDKAETLLKESLILTEKHPLIDPNEIATTCNNLGLTLLNLGKYEEAEKLLENAKNSRKLSLGVESADYATSLNNLGRFYSEMNEMEKAEKLLKESLEVRSKILGELHPETIATINNLGILYNDLRRFDEAQLLLEKALRLSTETLGNGHKDTIESMYSLAVFYIQSNKTVEGIYLLIDALRLSKEYLSDSHEITKMIDDYHRDVLSRIKII